MKGVLAAARSLVSSPNRGEPAGPRFPLRLALFGLLAVVSVYFGFVAHDVAEARDLVQRGGYYTIALTFVWGVIAVVRLLPAWWPATPEWSRREAIGMVATILLLTVVAAATVPYTYKVLYDEFVLQNTALNLHQLREVGTTVRGYEIEDRFTALGAYLDKRPFFFTFLLSLIHDLTGYRESNAFAINTALMPVILGLLAVLARRVMPAAAAWAVVVAFGAHSLLAHNATGAGMEMLNLAMLLLVTLLATHYLESPDEPRLAALVLTAVLLAQTRYESSLYIAPVAVAVLEGWRRAGRVILPAAAIFAPVLLVPYALHNTYLSGTPLLWELREGFETRFSVDYLGTNLTHAARYFFNFSETYMNSWWLGVAGLPALVWTAWCSLRSLRQPWTFPPAATVLVIFGAAVAANLGLLMFYYWGALDDPIVSRLSLPFCVFLALALGWTAMRFPERWRARAVMLVALGGAGSYLTTGLRANSLHCELNLMMREIRWETDWVDALPPANRLVISNKSPLIWIGRETPSVSMPRARWRADALKFHLDHHTFQEILVTQAMQPGSAEGDYRLEPADRLPESYVLEPVAERRFGVRLARISRVKEIRLPPAVSAEIPPPRS